MELPGPTVLTCAQGNSLQTGPGHTGCIVCGSVVPTESVPVCALVCVFDEFTVSLVNPFQKS